MGHATRRLGIGGCLLLALACGADGPTAARGVGTAVTLARFQAAREEFAAATRALAETEARGAAAAPGALTAARARLDAAYAQEQRALAVYLTQAVNERPTALETREALGLYATRAVELARLLLDHGGDPARAIEVLEIAGHPFRALGLPLPPELVTCLREARQRQARRGAVAGRVPGAAGN